MNGEKTDKTINVTGSQRYLIARISPSGLKFLLGNYILDSLSKKFSFHDFSGTLILTDLELGNEFVIKYKDGKNLTTSSKPGFTTSDIRYECKTYMDCQWSVYCGGDAINFAFTSGTDYCSEPSFYPCGFGTPWILVNQTSTLRCEYILYPDPGFPGTPVLPGSPLTYNSIVKTGSALADGTRALLQQIADDCMGKTIIAKLASVSKTLIFVEKDMPYGGSYNPPTETVTLPIDAGIYAALEELIHAYQDAVYPGGTQQYLDGTTPGSQNIELEAKMILDFRQTVWGSDPKNQIAFGTTAMGRGVEFYDWIYEATDFGKKYPDNFETIRSDYFRFLDEFATKNPGYAHMSKNPNLDPKIMFQILKDSKCL